MSVRRPTKAGAPEVKGAAIFTPRGPSLRWDAGPYFPKIPIAPVTIASMPVAITVSASGAQKGL